MLHSKLSARKKSKSTNQGITKRKSGNPKNDLLATPGHKKSFRGESIVKPITLITQPLNQETTEVLEQSELRDCLLTMIDSVMPAKEEREELQNDNFNPKIIESEKKYSEKLETIEEIEFKKGDNKLILRYSKLKNNMYRLSIWLNDELEIRPVTYSGKTSGQSYWEMLKRGLLK